VQLSDRVVIRHVCARWHAGLPFTEPHQSLMSSTMRRRARCLKVASRLPEASVD
jgi:hypothetical protein